MNSNSFHKGRFRQRLCKQMGISDIKFKLLLLSGIVLMVLCFAYACGKDNASGSSSWSCDITLTLVPSTIGGISSPTGSGTGNGTGATQEEALRAALKTACSQLNLDSDTRSLCESGQDFVVGVTSGGITLGSAVERSQSCSSSSTF